MAQTDPIKEQILNRADLVEIVSHYVRLKRNGNRYVGLCPFHKEKTPSFSVNPDRQFFHCFGCGKGGNVIDFIMSMENLTFPEARRHLAGKLGIPLEEFRPRNAKHQEIDRFQVMDTAAQLFQKWLRANEAAMKYLRSRGLEDEHVERFGLGYAPDQWESLHMALNERKIPIAVQQELGLVIPRTTGSGCYDRFRNRLMFPIRNTLGRVIAFGGRTLDPNENAKYLNSNDTPLFNKSRVLYLLDLARQAIKDQGAVIVEGYMDALALHIHGFTQGVASLGTALTRDHLTILKRYTDRFTLLYDSDNAGIQATLRGVETFFEAGLPVRVLTLPDGKDPDDFLKKHEPPELQALLDRAVNGFEYYLEQKLQGKDLGSPEGKSQVVKEMLPLLARVGEAYIRKEYVQILAQRIGGDLASLEATITKGLKKSSFRPSQGEEQPAFPSPLLAAPSMVTELKRNLVRLLACHFGVILPEGMSAAERPALFSRKELDEQLPHYMQWLEGPDQEDRLLRALLDPAEWSRESAAAFIEQRVPDPQESALFIHIVESIPLPASEKMLRKMHDEILEGLRVESEREFHQSLVRRRAGDPAALLQEYNEYIFSEKHAWEP